MGLRACLDLLPDGFEVVQGKRGVLAVRSEYRAALLEADHGPDGAGGAAPSELAGRRALGELVVRDERLVVRRFHHGGLLRWINDERFGDPARPFEELILSVELERRGVCTPAVVAARAQRARLFGWGGWGGWRLALITKRIERATDSSHVIARLGAGELPPSTANKIFEALGDAVGGMHRAGLLHTDLTPRNMLIEDALAVGGEGRVWILDLDRCALRSTLTDEERRRGLRRLLRYVSRREALRRGALHRTRLARFLCAYEAALGASRASWKDDWRAVARGDRRASLLHRVGWTLEESVGGGPETRDGLPR